MNSWTLLLAVCALLVPVLRAQDSQPASRSLVPTRDDAAAESLGWRLGTQAWTFRDRTAFEVIATADRLGLRYVEFFPGQPLSKAQPEWKMGPDAPAEAIAALQATLREHRVQAVSYGVTGLWKDEARSRVVFEFARKLGLETITAEPEADAFATVSKLCDEFGLRVALHDHPKPSPYWSPELVLAAIQGQSERIGACADTGHWLRSGLVPLECLQQLAGRIVTLHFKDISGQRGGIDMPWGTGKGNARGMLAELQRQKFRGVILVEYEHGSGEALEANVAKCIRFFDAVAAELVSRR